MRAQGWHCFKVGAGKFVAGWPDYYCLHPAYGHRWMETKAKKEKLTPAQLKRFKRLSDAGDKIYVLTGLEDYRVLFKERDNWKHYQRGL